MNDFLYSPADIAAVGSASRILMARYKDYVEYEDVQQELYLWLYRNYERVCGWREEHSEQHAKWTVVKALRSAGERYCRREKAEREGYLPDDEYFYSLGMVGDLLQVSFDKDWMMPPGVDMARPNSGTPSDEGGNLIAMIADVKRAYKQMPKHDRDLLARVFEHGVQPADVYVQLALEWDITTDAARLRVSRVLGRLRAALGGPSPYRKDEA